MVNSPSRARNALHKSSFLRVDSRPRLCKRSEEIDFGTIGGISEEWAWVRDDSLSNEKDFGIKGTRGTFGSEGALPRKALSGLLGFLLATELLILESIWLPSLGFLPVCTSLFLEVGDEGTGRSSPGAINVGPSTGAGRFLGEGDREAVLHDFLAKIDREFETERDFGLRPTALPALPVSGLAAELSSHCVATVYFEMVIFGFVSERMDEYLPKPLPLASSFCWTEGRREISPCGLARAFSERVRLILRGSDDAFAFFAIEI